MALITLGAGARDAAGGGRGGDGSDRGGRGRVRCGPNLQFGAPSCCCRPLTDVPCLRGLGHRRLGVTDASGALVTLMCTRPPLLLLLLLFRSPAPSPAALQARAGQAAADGLPGHRRAHNHRPSQRRSPVPNSPHSALRAVANSSLHRGQRRDCDRSGGPAARPWPTQPAACKALNPSDPLTLH